MRQTPAVLSGDAGKTFLINTHERQIEDERRREGERRTRGEEDTEARRMRSKVIKLNYYRSRGCNKAAFLHKMTRTRKTKTRRKRGRRRDRLGWETAINKLQMSEKWRRTRGQRGPRLCQKQGECLCVCVLLYLSKPSLAVSDVGPVFAIRAVSQFVLPDKCSVLRTALQASCTLGNNATHHLGHTEVHLQHTKQS